MISQKFGKNVSFETILSVVDSGTNECCYETLLHDCLINFSLNSSYIQGACVEGFVKLWTELKNAFAAEK